ncbi:hypothetical protein Zmor_003747 [Zophobas morio]|uniref:DDE Tnp4 domain-containing protein n=1 Tax=Zophobas morio TaxID=2755281 RepID=A0AA38HNF6_9CUCU|nr:hypothetical protein Zmor_003747 [Zophobas morio]
MISEHMRQPRRPTGIPSHIKILATLHFYATGSYQLSAGQGYHFAISQSSMSRCINEVTNIVNQYLLHEWIVFPATENERNNFKREFYENFHFPRCLGAIDCTHVAIIAPPENYPALPYYCRKGFYSINCQIIVSSNLKILGLNARFPGSTHDSAIWQASNIKTTLQNLYLRGDDSLLIGDSGYPLQPFLITPFENPEENSPESRYNYHFIRARNVIERLNGVLKSRFRCLLKHRVLNYRPTVAGKIIYSCGVLHNIAQHYNDNLRENEIIEEDEEDDFNEIVMRDGNWHRRGEEVRNQIVQRFFT